MLRLQVRALLPVPAGQPVGGTGSFPGGLCRGNANVGFRLHEEGLEVTRELWERRAEGSRAGGPRVLFSGPSSGEHVRIKSCPAALKPLPSPSLQEEAKSFLTPQNLEARIEECLDNPRNYNFAVDKEGRVVRRTVLP